VEPAIGPTIGELISAPLPQYIPPINVPLVPFQAQLPRQGPLSLFLSFLGEPALRTVVENTNSYARNWRSKPLQKRARPWHDLSRNEFLRWIGLLFYIGRYTEPQRTDYWRVSDHNLGRYMGMSRWEQIHRFLSIRDEVIFPILPGESWYYKLEPVASQIRQNCERTVIPYSWVSVDEGMILFQGRSRHTVKLRDKSIEEGFKVWICAFGGYVISWLWHSGLHGPEGIPGKRWV
jgi:Transposase IS4